MLTKLLLLVTIAAAVSSLTIPATIRDFTPQTNSDFQKGIAIDERNLVLPDLGADNKPVFNTLRSPAARTTSEATFNQWYRDVSGVNMNIPITLELTLGSDGRTYSYSSTAFFPINGQGFGNYASTNRNYHFTTEIAIEFTYNGTQSFTFTGDDDVFVFINRKLVIDLGGVHGPQTGTVDLSNLGLTIGETYPLHVFHAERQTSGSNFRIETNLVFRAPPASVCGNGVVEGSEQCDGGSCCTSSCTFSQDAICFCSRQNFNGRDMGYFCNGKGGFYQCLSGVYASQSRAMMCAQGTECGCANGQECSCDLSKSPCVTAGQNQQC